MLRLLFLIALFCGCSGFTNNQHKITRLSSPKNNRPITTLNVLPEAASGSFEYARQYFFIWFFGGSGGAGVALRQFPAQYSKFQLLQSMADEGQTLGGETIGISPLCLYPRDINKADLDKVLNNKLSVTQMVEKGPKVSYMAQKGYLSYAAFVEANKNCNPLTVRAVFDAISTGDNANPIEAQETLDAFANDTNLFKSELLRTKLTGFASIAFLLFLLGPIVGSTCLEAAAAGWFPEWEGNANLPWSLLVGPGFWTIPQYWI